MLGATADEYSGPNVIPSFSYKKSIDWPTRKGMQEKDKYSEWSLSF